MPQVADIQNQAKEVRQVAEAQSSLIHTVSQANYTAVVEKARSAGLKELYDRWVVSDVVTATFCQCQKKLK